MGAGAGRAPPKTSMQSDFVQTPIVRARRLDLLKAAGPSIVMTKATRKKRDLTASATFVPWRWPNGAATAWEPGMLMRFVVFDDALPDNGRGWMADDLAAALRAPLAALGVRVVRRHRSDGNSHRSGFQARGISARAYKAKSQKVRSVLDGILNLSEPQH